MYPLGTWQKDVMRHATVIENWKTYWIDKYGRLEGARIHNTIKDQSRTTVHSYDTLAHRYSQ